MHASNFRNTVINEPRVFGGQYGLNTSVGVVSSNIPPPLPPRPAQQSTSYGIGPQNRYSVPSYGFGGFGNYGFNNYGYGAGMLSGIGSSSMYNSYGFNSNIGYPENRFIQIAEESSRPAFQNIESLVSAIGNIASMLDSTFFALTSSFRAVLGVAANFAHLRGVFTQFWTSFTLFRGIIWLYRKLLYTLKISKTNPTESTFRDAFKSAEQNGRIISSSVKKGSAVPVILFLSFILSAPYLIVKFFGNGNDENAEKSENPFTWENPLDAIVMHNFEATNHNELSIRSGQKIVIAPKPIQEKNNLLHTGWVLASVDKAIAGLVPVNYIQGSKQQKIIPSNEEISADK